MTGEITIGEIGSMKCGELKVATEQYLAKNNISNIIKEREYFETQKDISNFIGELK